MPACVVYHPFDDLSTYTGEGNEMLWGKGRRLRGRGGGGSEGGKVDHSYTSSYLQKAHTWPLILWYVLVFNPLHSILLLFMCS